MRKVYKFPDLKLENLKQIHDISMKWTPLSSILKEVSSDTKYIGVWPILLCPSYKKITFTSWQIV